MKYTMSRKKFSQSLIVHFLLLLVYVAVQSPPIYGQADPSGEIDLIKCWTYPMNAAGTKIATDGIRIYVGTANGNVAALSLDGTRIWSSDFGGEISSDLLALDDGLYLATSSVSSDPLRPAGGVLRSVSKETGITNWTVKLPEAREHFLQGYRGTIVVMSQTGIIQALNAQDGSGIWNREATTRLSSRPLFSDGSLIVPTDDKELLVLSILTGNIESRIGLPFRSTALSRTADGDLIAGDERGNITSLASGSGRTNWKFKSGGEISSISAIGTNLFTRSHDNFVYFLASKNGGVTWKKRLPGRVSHSSEVMDGFALISAVEQNGAVLTDLANGKVSGQIVFGDGETLAYEPVATAGLIVLLTNKATYSYSVNGCTAKIKAVQEVVPAPQSKESNSKADL